MDTLLQTDRRRLDVGPAMVLNALPRLGRIMIIGRYEGATHERIGAVETVDIAHDRVRLGGAAHDSEVEHGLVHAIGADFDATMGGKPMPRLEFLDARLEPVLAVVCLDGRDAFDRTFGALPAQRDAPRAPAARAAGDDVAPDDAGLMLLQELARLGATVTLRMARPGFTQEWRGAVDRVTSAMGFANVMTDSFHLHLRGGAVARWRRDDERGQLAAIGPQGTQTGLFVLGDAGTLAALAGMGTGA